MVMKMPSAYREKHPAAEDPAKLWPWPGRLLSYEQLCHYFSNRFTTGAHTKGSRIFQRVPHTSWLTKSHMLSKGERIGGPHLSGNADGDASDSERERLAGWHHAAWCCSGARGSMLPVQVHPQ